MGGSNNDQAIQTCRACIRSRCRHRERNAHRGSQRRRHEDRFRRSARHRVYPDADRHRTHQGARRQCRTDHPQRRRPGRPGDRRRPGRCRHRHALHADPEGGRADPPVRADFDASLLPGRQWRILQDLEGSRRAGGGGAGARLRHRGGHAADGKEPRHHARQHQLCAGFGGAPQCANPGNASRHRSSTQRTGARSRRKRRASSSCCRSRI